MEKPKVLILPKLPDPAMAYLAEHCEIVEYPKGWKSDKTLLYERLHDAVGLVPLDLRIDAELLAHAPNLKVVSNFAVGYDNFDTEAMKARGVIGTHTPHVLNDSVADLVLALMLAAARRIPELDSRVKNGEWGRTISGEALYGIDVHHKTLGIIGLGRIGEAIAKRAKFGFDMNILYCNRSRSPEAERTYGARHCSLDELLGESDFVVLMTPLTPETRRMIGKEHFEKMKRTAVFINASRGQTVDEEALIEALEQGRIYAAGLDVFDTEPVDPANRLLKLPNAVTVPHIGSATRQTRTDMAMLAARNLVAGVTGQVPPNVVPELK